MLERNMKDQRARLYSIGDFVGYVECVGKHRRQGASEKKWRLMQVSDKLSSGDVRLLDRMQIEIYRPLVRSIRFVPRNKLSRAKRMPRGAECRLHPLSLTRSPTRIGVDKRILWAFPMSDHG
jgi:hypothetical protein